MKKMNEYYSMKRDFFQKHDGLDHVDTGMMNEYGNYSKWYFCTDGATLYECNGPVWMDVDMVGNIGGVEIKETKSIKFFRTEAWTSDDAKSEYFYEAWH